MTGSTTVRSPRHSRLTRRLAPALAVATVVAVGAALPQSAAAASAGSNAKNNRLLDVQLLSFNDFHGHLLATDPPLAATLDPSQTPAGGVEYLSAKLAQLRKGTHGNTLTVAAGDLIGGSTFISGLFHDEPSVEALETLGLDISSVGNHEFDEGTTELLRMQNGGCHPVDGCYFPSDPYDGADFRWLAANVVKKSNGKPLLPPTAIRYRQGVPIGFIGMTLKATPTLVAPPGVATVEFKDEVETANAQVKLLKKQGVKAIVVLIHEGGVNAGTYDGCTGISGPIVQIAQQLDPEIDMVVSGHTHQPYVCSIPDPNGQPRFVTSAASFGQVVTESHLVINKQTKQVVRDRSTSRNVLVDRTTAPDPAETAVIAKWNAISGPLAGQIVGTVSTDIKGDANDPVYNRAIESPMADLVADSILAGTSGANGGAQLAFVNPGGVRASLLVGQITNGEQPGQITYQEAYNVQPFGNLLVSIDMTGDQIRTVLEQQYQPVPLRGSRPMLALGVSNGFTYTWDATQPQGSRVVPGSMALNGVPLDLNATYRVGTLNFLQTGGDLFTGFRAGSNLVGGPEDLAAFVSFLGASSPVAPPADRIAGL